VGVGRRKMGGGRGRGNFEFKKGEWICDDLGIWEGVLTWGRGFRLEVRGGMVVKSA
jgi:hypothetical protein